MAPVVTELVPPLTEATEAATFLAVSALAASAAALANAAALAKLGIHVELELNPSQLGGYLIRRKKYSDPYNDVISLYRSPRGKYTHLGNSPWGNGAQNGN